MATFVLIPGAASDSSYWYLVEPELRALGHEVVAPDLPVTDDSAGFSEYADAVIAAVGDSSDVVVVAQSLGGFTAALVADRIEVDLVVLVAAMVPMPGEAPGDWWENTGWQSAHDALARQQGRAVDDFDPISEFFHDVPADVTEFAMQQEPLDQAGTPLEQPWPLDGWPDVPTRFLLCRNDRFFPAGFMRTVVEERLGITPDEMDSGHLPALAHPVELARRLDAYRAEHRQRHLPTETSG